MASSYLVEVYASDRYFRDLGFLPSHRHLALNQGSFGYNCATVERSMIFSFFAGSIFPLHTRVTCLYLQRNGRSVILIQIRSTYYGFELFAVLKCRFHCEGSHVRACLVSSVGSGLCCSSTVVAIVTFLVYNCSMSCYTRSSVEVVHPWKQGGL